MSRLLRNQLLVLLTGASLAGCGGFAPRQDSGPSHNMDLSHVPDAVPRWEPRTRAGNPDTYVVHGKRYHVLKSSEGFVQRGTGSWYGEKFHGRKTSNGERYNMYAMTAAHKTLPIPTYVQVTNLKNSRRVIVRINDRGPFHDDRIIDLSYAAASKLGYAATGTAPVEIRAITPGNPLPAAPAVRQALVQPAPAATADTLIPPAAPALSANGIPQPHKQFVYLQMGAFMSRTNAEQLQRRLLDNELPKVAIHTQEGPETLYRVRIGPLTVKEADQVAGRMARLGIGSAKIVRD